MPKSLEAAYKDLDDRLITFTQTIGNIKRYLSMAETARNAGDDRVAKLHLKRALDLEFGITFECETAGDIAEVWYPGREL